MPAKHARVKDLFVAAIELPDPAARAALLDRECAGNTDLRARLVQLLHAHDYPIPAVNGPLVGPAPDDATAGRTLRFISSLTPRRGVRGSGRPS
jgi:hypothetical protein